MNHVLSQQSLRVGMAGMVSSLQKCTSFQASTEAQQKFSRRRGMLSSELQDAELRRERTATCQQGLSVLLIWLQRCFSANILRLLG